MFWAPVPLELPYRTHIAFHRVCATPIWSEADLVQASWIHSNEGYQQGLIRGGKIKKERSAAIICSHRWSIKRRMLFSGIIHPVESQEETKETVPEAGSWLSYTDQIRCWAIGHCL
ncbi:unnamed protein product [Caretta caretta]